MHAYVKLLRSTTIWPAATRHAFLEKSSALIENQVVFHVLGTNWWSLIIIKDLECYFHCTHFLLYCPISWAIPIFLVQNQGFLHSFGHINPKFVCHLVVSPVDCCYDSLSLFQDMGCPPGECRFITYTHHLCIFITEICPSRMVGHFKAPC